MPRHVARILIFSTMAITLASAVSAQSAISRPTLVGRQASAAGGRIHGLVHDEGGVAVAGASIVAMGTTPVPVMARSDAAGQFSLALPPGEYILRATRDGYVSTYREPVRVQSSVQLERNIILVRQGVTPSGRVVLASTGLSALAALPDEPLLSPEGKDADHAHNEAAWRLRHLMPTALRDISETHESFAESNTASFRPRPSFVDWMMGESARAAASFFANTNFTGQVNFLTTSSLTSGGGWLPVEAPRRVAYVSVGAPVGSSGDWTLRGAMNAGTLSSWVVLAEYSARDDQPHALTAGVSYSSQLSENGSELAPAGLTDRVRSVGGMYAFDRWQVRPAFEIDYGLRLDRYDYVAESEFLSPRLGFRLRLLPGTHVTMLASERVVAPGADEFLPPPSAGPWLPPERTFAPLLPAASFQAERIRNFDVGVEQQLGRSKNAPLVGLRRFRQSADNQVATLFGLDAESGVGHYYVATPGAMLAQGWIMHVAGRVSRRVSGSVDYTVSRATWNVGEEAMAIATLAPSVVRGGERLHDITTSIHANIPETSTKVSMSYRMNSAYSGATSNVGVPRLDGRFDVEVRQALRLHPTRGSRTELVLVVRNLFRDLGDAGSLYDELLTVAPPMRVMGGVQVRF